MIETRDQVTRNRSVTVRAAHHLTVGDVLAFADKLRERQIPDGERINDDHDHNTQHLTGLRVQVSDTHDTPQAQDGA